MADSKKSDLHDSGKDLPTVADFLGNLLVTLGTLAGLGIIIVSSWHMLFSITVPGWAGPMLWVGIAVLGAMYMLRMIDEESDR